MLFVEALVHCIKTLVYILEAFVYPAEILLHRCQYIFDAAGEPTVLPVVNVLFYLVAGQQRDVAVH